MSPAQASPTQASTIRWTSVLPRNLPRSGWYTARIVRGPCGQSRAEPPTDTAPSWRGARVGPTRRQPGYHQDSTGTSRGAGSINELDRTGFVAVAVCVAEEMVKNNNDDSSRRCILGNELRIRRQPTTALVRESPELRVVGKRFATVQ